MSAPELRRLYRSAELDHQPARRYRSAPGTRRDRALDLSRDGPGSSPDRAARQPRALDRLPRAARRLLHVCGEPRPARLQAARLEALLVPSDAPTRRDGVLDGSARTPMRRCVHDRRQLAAVLAERRVPRRAVHVEQAPGVLEVRGRPRALTGSVRACSREPGRGREAPARGQGLVREGRPRRLDRPGQLPRVHQAFRRGVHGREGPERSPSDRLVQRP